MTYIATHGRCDDVDFDDFIFKLNDRTKKEADPEEGFSPDMYAVVTGFAVGFVYGRMVNIDSHHKELFNTIGKIEREMTDAKIFPCLSMKKGGSMKKKLTINRRISNQEGQAKCFNNEDCERSLRECL